MVSEHNLGSACGIKANMLSRIQEEENVYIKEKNKTPLFGGRKEEKLSKLLSQTMKNIKRDLKEKRKEMYRESPREFESKTNSRFSYDECEHATTHHDEQHSPMPRFGIRDIEEEEMPKDRKSVV